jgi:DNA-binding transcriptional LysR family regulator
MSFVRAGLGVAIVPAGATAGFNTDGLKTLPIIGPTLSRNLELITLKERGQPLAHDSAALIREFV